MRAVPCAGPGSGATRPPRSSIGPPPAAHSAASALDTGRTDSAGLATLWVAAVVLWLLFSNDNTQYRALAVNLTACLLACRTNTNIDSLAGVRAASGMVLSAAALERIGVHLDPDEFDRLIAEALEQVVPLHPSTDPGRELTTAEADVLLRGGFALDQLPLDATHPIVRSAAAYAALLGSSLSVAKAAERLGVEGSRIRQRLGERTLYGI
jgi:hypothetical protein